jgi:hypothetical protein
MGLGQIIDSQITDSQTIDRVPEYKYFLYSESHLRKCQSVQQNFA